MVSSRAVGWAEPTARGWAQPGLQQRSHCVTQYYQKRVASAHRWHEFSPCWVTYWTGMELIPHVYQHKRESQQQSWLKVAIMINWTGLCSVYPSPEFWEHHRHAAYLSFLSVTNNQHSSALSGKREHSQQLIYHQVLQPGCTYLPGNPHTVLKPPRRTGHSFTVRKMLMVAGFQPCSYSILHTYTSPLIAKSSSPLPGLTAAPTPTLTKHSEGIRNKESITVVV